MAEREDVKFGRIDNFIFLRVEMLIEVSRNSRGNSRKEDTEITPITAFISLSGP